MCAVIDDAASLRERDARGAREEEAVAERHIGRDGRTVGLGELVVCYGLGLPLSILLDKLPGFKKLLK